MVYPVGICTLPVTHDDNMKITILSMTFQVVHATDVLDIFLWHPVTRDSVIQHSCDIIKHTYLHEIHGLASAESGWHFGVSNSSTKQLEDFSLEEMVLEMENHAPQWWSLLSTLLDEDTRTQEAIWDGDGPPELENDVASYWDQVDEIDLEGLISGLTGESIASDNKQKCRTTNKMMVGGASWPSYDIEDELC
ncbi:hypothetical protein SCLCIDRAFT_6195 [Scleroderma citrinum Foug A]|uniref:Uncharacterized protein n=1 Tax=Scleroderma citrinum Foug A TaxID=1036808 RepID=A0A0C3A9T7_9AGAM|nr:hypothetical protein SCLCIDRAFT_6195 [Scleroderma citrinum Foug A]